MHSIQDTAVGGSEACEKPLYAGLMVLMGLGPLMSLNF